MLAVIPRLAAFDLDGTLLDQHLRVTPRTVRALHRLADAGAVVALASGRYRSLTRKVAVMAGSSVSHSVTSNGSVIVRYEGEDLEETTIDRISMSAESVETVIHHFRRSHPGILFAVQDEETMNFEVGFMAGAPHGPIGTEVPDLLALPHDAAIKMWVYHPELDEFELVPLLDRELSAVAPHLTSGHTGVIAAEIGPKGVDKAAGVMRLAEHLGIDAADVLAMGDGANDRRLLEWAGMSVAMINADATTQACARAVTESSNEEDGVARHLEMLLDG